MSALHSLVMTFDIFGIYYVGMCIKCALFRVRSNAHALTAQRYLKIKD